MRRVPATGEPPVLAQSGALAGVGLLPASVEVHASCSPAERQPAGCPDRELDRLCVALRVAETAELPSEFLHPRSYGCSPPARSVQLPPRGQVEPASPGRTSGRPELVRAESQ